MTTRDNRNRIQVRIDAVKYWIAWHCFSGITPHYLVVEYPKSGGTWLSQMLADYLDVPFHGNQWPPLLEWPSSVLHGHYLYSRRFQNLVLLLRDGRDVMTSAYYHLLFHNDTNIPWHVERTRRRLPLDNYEDVETNMPAFIEFLFVKRESGGFRHTWSEFVASWIDKDVNLITYEDLLSDTPGTLCKAIQKITQKEPDMHRLCEIAARFSFENVTKRKPGEEDPNRFIRKGIAGDWKSKFTKEACEVFDHYAGDALIQAGYEKDRSWIDSADPSAAAPEAA